MIGRILEAIARSQAEKGPVLELQLWSKEAFEALTHNPEFKGGKFIGISVSYPGRDLAVSPDDFILVTKD
ncbi:hypothetical protein [Pseudomonas syringae]|uniref:hypothetical protein n=1 Tax=Pseudomonas syringae TaxID=317 RepID=UPI003F7641B0